MLARSHELHFAVLARPTVQAVRFLGKAALAWFLPAAAFGEAVFAGLVVFVAFRLAYLSLDEVVAAGDEPDRGLWRRLRRVHHATGALAGAGLVALGLALDRLAPGELGLLLVALAPTVWVSNLAVLPTALLVRQGRYRAVLGVDLGAAVALAAAALAAAASGLGAWSLVAGWWANALVAASLAWLTARPHLPRRDAPEEAARRRGALRLGRRWTGAALVDVGGDRADAFGVRVVLGSSALGLYEWALHLSHFPLDWAASVGERVLLPALARHHRERGMAEGLRRALRLCLSLLLPVHVLLALVAGPAVVLLFPAEWHAAAPLVAILLLASGVRSTEIVAVTALKAGGAGGVLLRLAAARLALVALVLPWALGRGVEAVALAVLAARTAGAALTFLALLQAHGAAVRAALRPLAGGALAFAVWGAACLAGALALRAPEAGPAAPLALVAAAALLHPGVRALLDRRALRDEAARLAARLRVRPRGSRP